MSKREKLTADELRARNRERTRLWRAQMSPEQRERMRLEGVARQKKYQRALPAAIRKARNREAWLKHGKTKTSRRRWSDEDNAKMRQCYPTYPRAELERMLRRPWAQIAGHATTLCIKRRLYIPTKTRELAANPLVQALVERRINSGITITSLAKKIGVDATRVSCWELGRNPPELQTLRWWAEALGMKVALTEVSAPIVTLRPVAPWTERLTFDETARTVAFDGCVSRRLTGTEVKLLRALSTSVRSKEQILAKIYGDDDDVPELKIIDVFVCKLRTKLTPTRISIETVWGEGYYLALRGAQARAA